MLNLAITILFSLSLLGWLVGFFLFRYINQFLLKNTSIRQSPDSSACPISIIIPMRNESENITDCLQSLKGLKIVHEIIIANDQSTDDSVQKVLELQTQLPSLRLIEVTDKPEGWIGKNWACYTGAKQAKFPLLLFLDADVRLNTIEQLPQLLNLYDQQKGIITILPQHKVRGAWEQFSLFFNLMQSVAISCYQPPPAKTSAFGPVVLLHSAVYQQIGGHEISRKKVLETLVLAERARQLNIPVNNYFGKDFFYFRMYPNLLPEIWNGWKKIIASGAQSTPLPITLGTIAWFTGLFGIIGLIFTTPIAFFMGHIEPLIGSVIVYFLYFLHLNYLQSQIGQFKRWIVFLYPLAFLFFQTLFVHSALNTIFKKDIYWKGRKV